MINSDNWLENLEFRSRCDCCHRVVYGCIDAEYDGENWHMCPRCYGDGEDDPRDRYIDPDYLRDMRSER